MLLVEELALSEVGRQRGHDGEHALLLNEPPCFRERGGGIGLVVGELGELDLAATGQLTVAVRAREAGLRADRAVPELPRVAQTGHLDRGVGHATRLALSTCVGRHQESRDRDPNSAGQ